MFGVSTKLAEKCGQVCRNCSSLSLSTTAAGNSQHCCIHLHSVVIAASCTWQSNGVEGMVVSTELVERCRQVFKFCSLSLSSGRSTMAAGNGQHCCICLHSVVIASQATCSS